MTKNIVNCEKFRNLVFNFPIDPSESDLYMECMDHRNQCDECTNIYLKKIIEDRGHNPDNFCCPSMGEKFTFICDDHPTPGSCYDYVIVKGSEGDIGISAYGGNGSYCKIDYCPWCGKKLGC